jgi:hypothetical protein
MMTRLKCPACRTELQLTPYREGQEALEPAPLEGAEMAKAHEAVDTVIAGLTPNVRYANADIMALYEAAGGPKVTPSALGQILGTKPIGKWRTGRGRGWVVRKSSAQLEVERRIATGLPPF